MFGEPDPELCLQEVLEAVKETPHGEFARRDKKLVLALPEPQESLRETRAIPTTQEEQWPVVV